mgnify:CR=1 FL=1
MVHGDGCPTGAAAECGGVLMGADAEGNPMDGSDVTIYFYAADPSLEGNCSELGGSYSTL